MNYGFLVAMIAHQNAMRAWEREEEEKRQKTSNETRYKKCDKCIYWSTTQKKCCLNLCAFKY